MQFPGTKKKFPCIKCDSDVGARQEALRCEGCKKWQHRTCIPRSCLTREEYKRAVAQGKTIDWKCFVCIGTQYNRYMKEGEPKRTRSTRTKRLPSRFCDAEPTLKRSKTDQDSSLEDRSDASILRSLAAASAPEPALESASEPAAKPAAKRTKPDRASKTRKRQRKPSVERPASEPASKCAKPDREPEDSLEDRSDTSILRSLAAETPTVDNATFTVDNGTLTVEDTTFGDPVLESTRNEVDQSLPPPPTDGLPPLSPGREPTEQASVDLESTTNEVDQSLPPPPTDGLPPLSPGREPTEQASLDDIPYSIPDVAVEDSMVDPVVGEDVDREFRLTYKIIKKATIRGKDKLVDSRGYGYIVKRTYTNSVNWKCDVYKKDMKCRATVIQHGDTFKAGSFTHCHAALVGKELALKVTRRIKKKASKEMFKSAQAIVTDTLQLKVRPNEAVPAMPSEGCLRRTANRVRESMRPDDPADLNFELDTSFIPEGFLQKDITMDNGRRHIFYGTPDQLSILAQAKRWYIDGTFNIVRKPFYQLLTVHCFVKKDDVTKQVPLCYVVMSGKNTNDYLAVMRALRDQLPTRPAVKEVMVDFESAIWTAVKDVFKVNCLGCNFHWKNAVWKKIQNVGLQCTYTEKGDAHQLMRELMALPFLPAARIPGMLTKLRARAGTEKLIEVFDYVQRVWIDGQWKPECWSVFMQSVRTNNDVEGWHNRMNRRAQGNNLSFYCLALELFQESKNVNMQMELLSNKKLAHYQRKRSKQMQYQIFKFWKRFNNPDRDDWTTERLLRACAPQYGNAPTYQ